MMKAKTVSELIVTLSALPGDALVIAHEWPFGGVEIIPQDSGQVLIVSDTDNRSRLSVLGAPTAR